MTSLVFPIPPIHGLTPSNVDFEKKRQPLKYSNARIFFKCMKESATAWKNLIKYIFKWNKDIFTDHDITEIKMWNWRCGHWGKTAHVLFHPAPNVESLTIWLFKCSYLWNHYTLLALSLGKIRAIFYFPYQWHRIIMVILFRIFFFQPVTINSAKNSHVFGGGEFDTLYFRLLS
jgi:hypothetical protein